MLLPRFKPCVLNKVHAGDKEVEAKFLAASRLAVQPNPTSHPVGIGAVSPGIKRPGREDDYLILSRVELKNIWRYASIPITLSW
jgi:hypothetical protein